jgi:plasmid stabilization system protein ParE
MSTHYSLEAEQDLDALALYTLHVWGEEQRAVYLDMLQQICEVVLPAHWRKIARPYPKYPGVMRYRAEHHVVYFREVERGELEILTIRHDKRSTF